MSQLEVVDNLSQAEDPPLLGSTARNVAFAVIMGGMLLAALDGTIVATALPTIVGDLGGAEHMSWVVTAYLLTQTTATILGGKFGANASRGASLTSSPPPGTWAHEVGRRSPSLHPRRPPATARIRTRACTRSCWGDPPDVSGIARSLGASVESQVAARWTQEEAE